MPLKLLNLILTALALVIIISSCSVDTSAGYAPREIAEAIISQQSEWPSPRSLYYGDNLFTERLTDLYQIDAGKIADGAVYYADGLAVSEVAVFLLVDGADSAEIKNALLSYAGRRANAFIGYAPIQAAIASRSVVAVRGDYVALLICQDEQSAESVFYDFLSGNQPRLPDRSNTLPPSQSGGSDDVDAFGTAEEPARYSGEEYDPELILSAWKTGDPSALSEKNRKIFEACAGAIEAVISDNMTDYDKELAVHDWIALHAQYDPGALSTAPDAAPDPDNTNPYGLLINRKATCMGYATTFKLLMDMLEIECIIVEGFVGEGNEDEHAWNMVRLDGDWYIVDVTWDDPTGMGPDFVDHYYFNVTSRFLREQPHNWDEGSTPEAAGTRYEYRSEMAVE